MVTATTTYAKAFSIEGKGLKLNTAADVAEFVATLDASDYTEVRLNGNTIGVEAAQALAVAIKKQTNIQIINLSDMFTGRLRDEIPPALEAFVDALIDKSELEEVNLSDNAFGPAGALPLIRLFTQNRNIKTLYLNNNGLGPEGGCLIASALAGQSHSSDDTQQTAPSSNTQSVKPSNLQRLVMGRNRLENKAAEQLALAFPSLPNLRHLSLPQNGIRPEGCEALLRALVVCNKLETLDLQDNTLTRPGAQALEQGLVSESWPNLRVLHVGDCLLGDTGAAGVLRALANSKIVELTTLCLGFNEIEEQTALLVPAVLRKNKAHIVRLELNGNAFNPEGVAAKSIRDAVREVGRADLLDELDEMDWDEEDESEEEDESDKDSEADKDDENSEDETKPSKAQPQPKSETSLPSQPDSTLVDLMNNLKM